VPPEPVIRFKVSNQVPPGGEWFYRVPETKVYFRSKSSLGDVENLVRRNYKDNKLEPPDDLRQKIVEFICRNVAAGFCDGVSGSDRLTFFQVLRFTELAFKRLRNADASFLVTQEEAERRADICRECPENLLGICSSCNGLKQLASRLIARRKTRLDHYLGVCKICGCVLDAKIHVRAEHLNEKDRTDPKLPEGCWARKKEGSA